MLCIDLFETVRDDIIALYKKLPTRWRQADGSDVWKSPQFLEQLPSRADSELPGIKQSLQSSVDYLKANPKAKLADPLRQRGTRAENQTLRNMMGRVLSLPQYQTWLKSTFADDPIGLQTLKANDHRHHVRNFLDDELNVTIRPDGLITFWHLEPLVWQVIDDLPVALFHYTSSAVVKSIRSTGLEGDRKPVNDRKADGVYVTTEQSGTVATAYLRRAREAHGGQPVVITVKVYLNELEPDPDDADIRSGKTQFMVDHVAPDRIVSVAKA